MNRRWYDSNEHTQKALSLLKDMDEVKRRALSRDLANVVKQIKEMHEEDEEQDISIGIDRVLGLYKISNSRRWYDKVSILSYALKTMSTLPKEDFYNIMEGITTSKRWAPITWVSLQHLNFHQGGRGVLLRFLQFILKLNTLGTIL